MRYENIGQRNIAIVTRRNPIEQALAKCIIFVLDRLRKELQCIQI